MLRRLTTRLSSLFRRERFEHDLDKELGFHIDMLTEQHVKAGMPPGEARRAAMRAFGALDRVKDDVRDTWLSRLFETLTQDLRYGLRNLGRNPGFAVVVVLTMALGIGANTAIFSVVNGVLLRPLPYQDGDRLVVLRQQRPLASVEDTGFSYQEILDYRTRAQSLDGVVEFHDMWFILLGRAEPERVATGVVSANFFDVLGVQPAVRAHVPGRRREAGRAGRPDAEPQVLAAQLRRRPVGRRPHLPDERSAAPGDRDPAAGAAISARAGRLHADLRVSLPVGPGHDRQSLGADDARLRPGEARRDDGEGRAPT